MNLRARAILFLTVLPTIAAGAPWSDHGLQHIPFPNSRMAVNGLAWFAEEKPSLRRLPTRLKSTFPPRVWALAQAPAGGRLRFATDSTVVGLVAQGTIERPSPNTDAIADGGVDVYADGAYMGSAAPDAKGELRWKCPLGRARQIREVTIYLPIGKPLAVKEILLDSGATLRLPRAFALAKPVVYYGSSITQGFAASNAGMTYEAILGRRLNADFINLGFSGNGFGEPALARAVAEIDAACFVIDYWANPSTEVFRRTLPGFVAIIRKQFPETPIIVTGCYYNPSEEVPGDAGERQITKRLVARDFVASRWAAGDRRILYVDGLEMLSKAQADGLTDGRHANTLGFYYCAQGLEPYLRRALGWPDSDEAPPIRQQ